MVQMFALRGINIGVRKSLAGQMLYHGASSIVPSGIIHCTMRRGAINGIAPHKKKDLTFRVKSFSVVDIYVLFLQSLTKNRLNQFTTIVVGI